MAEILYISGPAETTVTVLLNWFNVCYSRCKTCKHAPSLDQRDGKAYTNYVSATLHVRVHKTNL